MIFQEKKIQLDNLLSADEIIKKINDLIPKGYFFSHFIADDKEVYEAHEEYLQQQVGEIEFLEVVAKSQSEFVNDLLLESEGYIVRAKPELIKLAEAFYDNPKPETWEQLNQLLEGLQWLDEVLLIIGKSGAIPSNWSAYLAVSSKMQEEIRNLAEALENEDHVLIGDILQYELAPNFEDLDCQIKKTMDNEGTRYDFS